MMMAEPFNARLQGGRLRVAPAAFASNPIWTSDPKRTPDGAAFKNQRPPGGAGKLGYASPGARA